MIAHELGHVKNRDTLTMTITAVIAGAIGMLANFAFFMGDRRNPLGLVGVLLVTLLAPIAAMLVQAAISRSREFEADRAGAELTGRPLWLADALAQIDRSGAQDAERARRRQSRHGAYVHHQSAAWRPERACSPAIRPRRSASRGCAPWRARRRAASRALGMSDVAGRPRGPGRAQGRALPSSPRCCASAARWMRSSTVLKNLAPRDAGFARALVSETLRHFGELDAVIRHFVPKPLQPHKAGPATEILLLGACELLILKVRAACRRGCRQQSGRRRRQGGAFQIR